MPRQPAGNERLRILDIWVDPVDQRKAIERVRSFLSGNRPCSVFAANPEKNFSVPNDPVLYDAFRHADLLIPDGIGIVLAARLLHGAVLSRVPGVEFMKAICRLSAEERKSVFVYGGREAVNETAVDRLQKQIPGLIIAGRSNGYVPETAMADLVKRINASKAEILFLALGSPKQEKWFSTHASGLNHVRVCQGIGGTLDTIAGNVKRAPDLWQRLSLEWLFRLISEPKRISRQKVLPVFAWRVFKQIVRSFDAAGGSGNRAAND